MIGIDDAKYFLENVRGYDNHNVGKVVKDIRGEVTRYSKGDIIIFKTGHSGERDSLTVESPLASQEVDDLISNGSPILGRGTIVGVPESHVKKIA